jgi:hypothetical protein
MTENQVTESIIGCAIEVHRAMGPGLAVGLLINFNVPVLRRGLRRLVNNYGGLRVSAPPR